MKAKKLLQLYKAGERDFQDINLHGESLKGQNLSDANFCGADIRGTDFSQACLKGSSFRLAKAGLQNNWLHIFGITAYLLTGLSGLLAEGISALVFTNSFGYCLVIYIILITLWIFEIQKGFKTFLFSFISSLSIFINVFIFVYIFLPVVDQETNKISIIILLSSTILSFCIFFAFIKFKSLKTYHRRLHESIFLYAFLLLPTFFELFTKNPDKFILGCIYFFNSFWISFLISTAITWIIFCMGMPFFFSYILQDDIGIATAILSSCIGIAIAFTAIDNASLFSLLLPLTVITLSIYMTRGFLSIQYKDSPIESLAVAIACMGGTSFRKADLTDASFSQADLGCTDFRQAKLTPTVLTQTKNLNRVRSSDSYYQICQNYFGLFIQILTDQKTP